MLHVKYIRFGKPETVFLLKVQYLHSVCTYFYPYFFSVDSSLHTLILHNIISLSSRPSGGFTFYELMQRGVPLHLINQYMNETKILEQQK